MFFNVTKLVRQQIDRKDSVKSVAIAMSGGVDSSVAAAVLREQGYYVIGLTMQLWDFERVGGNIFSETSCCSLETMYDARAVCQALNIPHYVIDVRDEFERLVIQNFESEYLKGRTPNPCILCNSKIKWQVLLHRAAQLGCDYFATGHYARVRFDQTINRYLLQRGIDAAKDQAYALWGLSQWQLSKTIFPLGELTKTQVRAIAERLNLKTKYKQESQEICFIPDNDYPRFLRQRNPARFAEIGEGSILNREGTVLGRHKGYPYYTIGQRKGLGIAVGKPIYVTEVDAERNQIIVGDKEDLNRSGLIASQVNWIAIDGLRAPMDVIAQIRYNDPGRPATVYPVSEDTMRVIFKEHHQAITPGQSVVLFDKDVVVGGGVIDRALE